MALPQATGHRNEQEQPLVGGSTARAANLTFPPPSLSFMCVLTFIEAIGLYGLIVGLLLAA
jgi:F0F1-type ATP synthase membrane subunit c/vacuolar-type H+-ATPase subunit K